jgi:hypothetical protein
MRDDDAIARRSVRIPMFLVSNASGDKVEKVPYTSLQVFSHLVGQVSRFFEDSRCGRNDWKTLSRHKAKRLYSR